jgi:hypothetical protein
MPSSFHDWLAPRCSCFECAAKRANDGVEVRIRSFITLEAAPPRAIIQFGDTAFFEGDTDPSAMPTRRKRSPRK